MGDDRGPGGPGTIDVPPSGYVAGIYARNDIERGVWKAPANEVVLGALRFSKPVNTARQEVLNPLGVNCLRSFENRGHRVWGARTASSDPEWKYLNVRRYFNYLERSIDLSTQWAVFEPNGRAPVGQRPPDDLRLPPQRVPDGRAPRRQAGGGLLRQAATARR